jgi:hypothetical protein
MFIEGDVTSVMIVLLIIFVMIVASIAIPAYGFHLKRLKGLVLGCILQPIVLAMVIALFLGGIYFYDNNRLNKQYKSAMITVKSTQLGDDGVDTLTWYLKADDECYMVNKGHERFDIIRLDSLSNSVCVEDRVIICFDLQNQKVTATDYDQPMEVVNIDWGKVKAYFNP